MSSSAAASGTNSGAQGSSVARASNSPRPKRCAVRVRCGSAPRSTARRRTRWPTSTIVASSPSPAKLFRISRLTRRRISPSSNPTASRVRWCPGNSTKPKTRRTPSRLSPVTTPSGDASMVRIIGWSANLRPTQLSRLGCRASSVPEPSTIITTASNDWASVLATCVNQPTPAGRSRSRRWSHPGAVRQRGQQGRSHSLADVIVAQGELAGLHGPRNMRAARYVGDRWRPDCWSR